MRIIGYSPRRYVTLLAFIILSAFFPKILDVHQSYASIFVVAVPNSQINCDAITTGTTPGISCFPTIQEAINKAVVIDSGQHTDIKIANGIYGENLIVSKSDLKITGQTKSEVTIVANQTSPYGISLDNVSKISIENMTIKTTSAGNYLGTDSNLRISKSKDISITNVDLIGPGQLVGDLNGAEIVASQNISLTDFSITGYSQHGLLIRSIFLSGDLSTSNVTLKNIKITNTGKSLEWAGLAFDTSGFSNLFSSNITGITFSGQNQISSNEIGIFFNGGSNLAYTITGLGGVLVDIGNTELNSNFQFDIYNMQSPGVTATSATFASKTGLQMTLAETTAVDAKVYDKNDFASLGVVKYVGEAQPPDITKPTALAIVSPTDPDGNNGWYKTNPLVKLTATDNYEVDKIQYQFNSTTGAWNAYSSEILITDGNKTFYYRSIDKAGNISDLGSKSIKVDTISPSKVANLAASYINASNEVSLIWDVTDSDIYNVYVYRGTFSDFVVSDTSKLGVNINTVKTYSDKNVTAGITYFYKLVSYDEAGNMSAVATVNIAIPAAVPAETTVASTTTSQSTTSTTSAASTSTTSNASTSTETSISATSNSSSNSSSNSTDEDEDEDEDEDDDGEDKDKDEDVSNESSNKPASEKISRVLASSRSLSVSNSGTTANDQTEKIDEKDLGGEVKGASDDRDNKFDNKNHQENLKSSNLKWWVILPILIIIIIIVVYVYIVSILKRKKN